MFPGEYIQQQQPPSPPFHSSTLPLAFLPLLSCCLPGSPRSASACSTWTSAIATRRWRRWRWQRRTVTPPATGTASHTLRSVRFFTLCANDCVPLLRRAIRKLISFVSVVTGRVFTCVVCHCILVLMIFYHVCAGVPLLLAAGETAPQTAERSHQAGYQEQKYGEWRRRRDNSSF